MRPRGSPAAPWSAHREGLDRLVVPRSPMMPAPHRHLARTPADLGYLLLLFALWWLNAADLALTLHWTGAVGWNAEGNRLMRSIAESGGTAGFVFYKLALMTLVVLVLWWLHQKVEALADHARARPARLWHEAQRRAVFAATLGLIGFYLWVIWNNGRVMGLI